MVASIESTIFEAKEVEYNAFRLRILNIELIRPTRPTRTQA